MKITFVIQDLFAQGAQRATASLARGFVDKGYQVDLIVSAFHRQMERQGAKGLFVVPDEVNWIHLKSVSARHNIGELRQYLKTTDAVAVISMCSPYTRALAVAAFGLRKRPRLYSVEHGITFALREDWSEKLRPRLFSAEGLWWALIKRIFDGFMAVSERIVREYERMYRIKGAKVVYNPVAASLATDVRGARDSMPTIITAGSFTNDKNHLSLLKAAAELHRAGERFTLKIFGKGPLEPVYRKFIKDNGLSEVVELPGYTECLGEELRRSDGYVCSSQIESFAIAPVEAMMFGVPVVCIDCPCGPREILADGKYGRLVPSGDEATLTSAFRDLVRGAVPCAPEEAWRRFSVESVTDRYIRAMGLDLPNDVEWLRPVNRGGYQFFREWATEAWENAGGIVRDDWRLPWKFKMLLGKLGTCFAVGRRNKKRLVVCVGGRIDYYAWPWCYFYEIVPIVWDCWPKYWNRLAANIRRLRIQTIFCTSSQTADWVRAKCPGVKAIWLPEGIKTVLYSQGPKLVERKTDILRFGRNYQNGGKRRFETFEDFTAGLRDAKIAICCPRCDTNPEMAGDVETLTQRYWECMLSGTLIVGRAPKELVDLCGYDPVLQETKVDDVLTHIANYQELADRNRQTAENLADWEKRVPMIREKLSESGEKMR